MNTLDTLKKQSDELNKRKEEIERLLKTENDNKIKSEMENDLGKVNDELAEVKEKQYAFDDAQKLLEGIQELKKEKSKILKELNAPRDDKDRADMQKDLQNVNKELEDKEKNLEDMCKKYGFDLDNLMKKDKKETEEKQESKKEEKPKEQEEKREEQKQEEIESQEDRNKLIKLFKALIEKLEQLLGVKGKVENEISKRPKLDLDKLNEDEIGKQNEELEKEAEQVEEYKNAENDREESEQEEELEEPEQEEELEEPEQEEELEELEQEEELEEPEQEEELEEPEQELKQQDKDENQQANEDLKESITARFKRLLGACAKTQMNLAKVEMQLKKRELGIWIDNKKTQTHQAIENAKESVKKSKVVKGAKAVGNKVVEGAGSVKSAVGKAKNGVVTGVKSTGTIVIGTGALTVKAIAKAKDTVQQAGQQTIQNMINNGRDKANSLLDKLEENVQSKESKMLEKQKQLQNLQNDRESGDEMEKS